MTAALKNGCSGVTEAMMASQSLYYEVKGILSLKLSTRAVG